MFLCVSCVATFFQVTMLNASLASLSGRLPHDGHLLLEATRSILAWNLAATLGLLVPAIVGLGILATFRIAGPIYRMEAHLRSVVEGTARGPCKVRENDELQEFCALLNQALEATAERADSRTGDGEERRAA